mgnify:FL=1
MRTTNKLNARVYARNKTYNVGTYTTLKEKAAAINGAKLLLSRLDKDREHSEYAHKASPQMSQGLAHINHLNRLVAMGLFDSQPEMLRQSVMALQERIAMVADMTKKATHRLGTLTQEDLSNDEVGFKKRWR